MEDFTLHIWCLAVVMAMISKRRQNEASILASFSISKRNEPVYSRTCKDRSENPAYSTQANSVYSTNSKDRSGANSAYCRNRQERSEKNKLDRSKTNRGGIFKTFMELRNRFRGIDSASLCPGGPVKQPYLMHLF